MSFDALNFFNDHSVEIAPPGHKHHRAGWVHVECPFCTGNLGYHLGFDSAGDYFTCWRCGWHPTLKVVQIFSSVSWHKAKELLRTYQTAHGPVKQKKRRERPSSLKLPSGSADLARPHVRYLQGRGFDPYRTMEVWGIVGTGPAGKYKHRVIAPIFYNGRLVSYQGRDITGRSELRYKACPQDLELIDHKRILYGIDLAESHKCILVEGITDAWRLGPGAVATFGVKTKHSQILLLAERFSKVFVMFDDDPEGENRAQAIAHDLWVAGIEVEVCLIDGDPAELPQTEADAIVKQLLG